MLSPQRRHARRARRRPPFGQLRRALGLRGAARGCGQPFGLALESSASLPIRLGPPWPAFGLSTLDARPLSQSADFCSRGVRHRTGSCGLPVAVEDLDLFGGGGLAPTAAESCALRDGGGTRGGPRARGGRTAAAGARPWMRAVAPAS